MGKLLQVRDVPEDVHRTLKARAAQRGASLSEYLRRELAIIAARPSAEEVLERLRGRALVAGGERPAAIIRRAREAGR